MTGHSGSYKGDGAKKEKQGTLQSFARPKHCSEARAKDITNRIANFVVMDMRSICALKETSNARIDRRLWKHRFEW